MTCKVPRGAFAAAVLSTALMTGAAFANTSDFVGNWRNDDPGASGITRIVVTPAGPNRVDVHVFGQCHPSDCDWGVVPGHGYSDGAGSYDIRMITASFNAGFARKLVLLRIVGGGHLRAQTLTDFTDSSGRTDYESTGMFAKVAMLPGPIHPMPIPNPGPAPGPNPQPLHPVMPLPMPVMGAEDCIGFNPGSVSVANVGGAWKVVQGSMWMLDFGGNAAGAHRAADIIHNYHFTEQCFVKRPHSAMMYWKANGHVPSNGMPADDCVGNNPATTSVANVNGSWKVVDGPHWMLDYGPDQAAANQALAVIKHYHLNRQCFVARPNAPMSYWLAE